MGKFEEISPEAYEGATARGKLLAPLRALDAKFFHGLILIGMSTGFYVAFDPKTVPRLRSASADSLKTMEIVGAGWTLHFPKLDEDISIPQLVADLGIPEWKKREARSLASRRNGKLGGRPRKEKSAA